MAKPDATDSGAPNLDGRRFRSEETSKSGEVGSDTTFAYRQDDDLIWAEYHGGAIRLGFLVGIRRGDVLEFRYAHVNNRGETATGHCHSKIITSEEGTIGLHERWKWDSKPGSGASILEEVSSADP